MKLVLNFKEAVSLFSDQPQYEAIATFAAQHFRIKRSTLELSFLDEDGDNISIISEDDVQVMLAVCEGKEYVKINVEGEVESTKIDEV